MSLRLHAVTRRFGAQLALDAVSLHVRRGDCYGFIGHNGAGKTTAMRIVLGLSQADGGRVTIDGFDARQWPREARARLGGLIEVPGFHGELDGAHNLRLFAGLQGLSAAATKTETARLLELVGLSGAQRKPVRAYSHGMRQRLGIALALLGKPAYVLLDEPTNGLDPQGIAEIRALLRHLVEREGVTVMLSSHQLHELAEVCNRIGVIHRGKLLIEAETSALLGAGAGRYAVHSPDPERVRAALRELGLQERPVSPPAAATSSSPRAGSSSQGGAQAKTGAVARRAASTEIWLDLGARAPADVARALFERGVALESFAPHPPTLEEIYLQTARGELSSESPRASAADGDARPKAESLRATSESAEAESNSGAVATAPAERRAPRRPILRMARYEFARFAGRPTASFLLALPAVLGVLALWRRHAELAAAARAVAAGEVFSATDVTAFEGVGIALRAGLPLLALVAAGVASQAVAGEYARGTLRNVVMRPLRRLEVGVGKACTHLAGTLAAYVLLAGLAVAVAGAWFGFRDLEELLPNGERFPLVAASSLWPELRRALLSPLLGLSASVGLGFLAGAVTTSAAGALGLALGGLLFLDLARSVARGFHVEGWLPTAYLPSPLGDTSFLKLYADLAQGISNSTFAFAHTAISVPLAWCIAAFLLAWLVLARRSIP